MKLAGQVALVTGAGGAIGRAICLRLAKEGASVAAVDLKADAAAGVVEELRASGGAALAVKADVTKREEVAAAARTALEAFGRVDILVNNAGGSAALLGKLSEFKDADEETWSWVVDLNLFGTMRFISALAGHMAERGSGRIINIGSIAGRRGLAGRADYSAAKGGVAALSKALAMELGPRHVTVNCVSPGLISRSGAAEPSDGTYAGRSGEPSEVASLVAFLASSEADFITGVDYAVDGGRTLGPTGF